MKKDRQEPLEQLNNETPAVQIPAVEESFTLEDIIKEFGGWTKNPEPSEPELPDNPIDFTAEAKKYPDIYAWIYIPNTNINYPVVQSPDSDEYYLNHSAEKKYKRSGAIYSELRFAEPQFRKPHFEVRARHCLKPKTLRLHPYS